MNYGEFKGIVNEQRYSYEKIKRIIEHVENNFGEPKLFYAKNFVTRSDNPILYFFYENMVLIIKGDADYDFIVHSFENKVVSKVLKKARWESQNHNLTIHFSNGEVLEFNSLNDSNERWMETYSLLLIELNSKL